jgi:hypothetical protein
MGGVSYSVCLCGLCAGSVVVPFWISSNSDESDKLPDDGRPLPKHVGACILDKEVVQFSACVGCFHYF